MKICIYGAGAMGTVLGAYLSKTEDVDLVSRNVNHIESLKKNGAIITGEIDLQVSVNALLPSEMKDTYDIIFLMTKQLENEAVVKSLIPFLKSTVDISTLKNDLP